MPALMVIRRCPLITERGQAMLVEFDYDLNMVPSFGFINPVKGTVGALGL